MEATSPGRDPGEVASVRILIKRQISLTPRQLCAFFMLAGGLSLGIALIFLSTLGAWPILPFAGLEALGLFFALLWQARHAGDYESITIEAGRVLIEVCEADHMVVTQLPALWVRVWLDPEQRAFLSVPGTTVEIGRFLARSERPRLAGEVKRRLR